MKGPQDAIKPLEGISNDTPQKPQEATRTGKPAPVSKAPALAGSGYVSNTEKAVATESMTQQEKQAVADFNKRESEKDDQLKTLLANQKKMVESLDAISNMFKPKKLTFDEFVNHEYQKFEDIIKQPYPKLDVLNQDDLRKMLYKNHKNLINDFIEERKKLSYLKKEIHEHVKKSNQWNGLYHDYQSKNKKSVYDELGEKIALMSMYLVYSMLHSLGLSKSAPNPWNRLTEQEKKDFITQCKRNEFAQQLLKTNNLKDDLNKICDIKINQDTEEKSEAWKDRKAVTDARREILKLDNIMHFDYSSMNEQEKRD